MKHRQEYAKAGRIKRRGIERAYNNSQESKNSTTTATTFQSIGWGGFLFIGLAPAVACVVVGTVWPEYGEKMKQDLNKLFGI